jgi:hypothetical protein
MDVPLAELESHLGSATATLERLAADGVIGQQRPARRPTAAERLRSSAREPVSDIISDQRE